MSTQSIPAVNETTVSQTKEKQSTESVLDIDETTTSAAEKCKLIKCYSFYIFELNSGTVCFSVFFFNYLDSLRRGYQNATSFQNHTRQHGSEVLFMSILFVMPLLIFMLYLILTMVVIVSPSLIQYDCYLTIYFHLLHPFLFPVQLMSIRTDLLSQPWSS